MHTHPAHSGVKPLIKFGVLAMICLVAFAVRLFAVIRFESIIHEFDPWSVRVRVHGHTHTHTHTQALKRMGCKTPG